MKRALTVLALSVTLVVGAAHAAHAETVDPAIAFALNAVPGGILVNETTVVWPELDMILQVPRLGT